MHSVDLVSELTSIDYAIMDCDEIYPHGDLEVTGERNYSIAGDLYKFLEDNASVTRNVSFRFRYQGGPHGWGMKAHVEASVWKRNNATLLVRHISLRDDDSPYSHPDEEILQVRVSSDSEEDFLRVFGEIYSRLPQSDLRISSEVISPLDGKVEKRTSRIEREEPIFCVG